jgi:hypothetical protein
MHGDFDPRAYYPRLRCLLGETDNIGGLPSFDKMILLWDDLEKWSTEDKHEELGRFVARIRGGWWKVGLPLSQTIISEDEQQRLPVLFEAGGMDPSAPPSPQVMFKLMRYHGDRIFEKRTLKVINMEKGDGIILQNKLIEIVLDELEKWDGTVQLEEAGKGREKKETHKISSGLRICLKYDPISGQVKTSLRLKTNRAYPDDGLMFGCPQFPGASFYCEEAYQGWSKNLRDEESKVLDAATVDWLSGVRLEDQENNWRASLKGDKVRLFVTGSAEGLPGWIETNRLDRRIRFLVSTFRSCTDTVCEWGNARCDSFEELEVKGLPPGWSLFMGLNASDSCEGIDVLTVSSSARLLLRGGVKMRGGNTYLYTAPPLIVLENAAGEASVTVNGKILRKERVDVNAWRLPYDTPPNEILRIEAKAGEEELRKILRLEEPSLSGSFEEAPWRDTKGQILSDGSNFTRIRGAVVEVTGTGSASSSFVMKPSASKQLIFIGNIPGQVREWPKEPFPTEWQPVWSIEKESKKRWTVSCCRKSLDSIPLPDVSVRYAKRRYVKKWKEYVWVRRKKIKKPGIPAIRQKWLEFSGAVKNV